MNKIRFWLDFTSYLVKDTIYMITNRLARSDMELVDDAWMKACADYSEREDDGDYEIYEPSREKSD